MEQHVHEHAAHAGPARSRDTLILEELGLAASPRRLTPGTARAIRGAAGRDPGRARPGPRHRVDAGHPAPLPRRDGRGDRRLRGRPEARDGVPHRVPRAAATAASPRSSRARSSSRPCASTMPCRSSGTRGSGYVAHERILGISKLTRLVRLVTRRFAVQERLTHSLADTIESLTQAHGVAVYLEAEHLCMRTRGVREHGTRTRTTAYRGVYEQDPSLRAEFRDLALAREATDERRGGGPRPRRRRGPTPRDRSRSCGCSTTPSRTRGAESRGGLLGELARRYDGDLRIAAPPGPADASSPTSSRPSTGSWRWARTGRTGGGEVSGFSPTDRFVMGLLRSPRRRRPGRRLVDPDLAARGTDAGRRVPRCRDGVRRPAVAARPRAGAHDPRRDGVAATSTRGCRPSATARRRS